MLCPYRHIFGEERKGFHSLRLFDIAIGDVFLTILLSLFISYVSKLNVITTFIIVFIIGIVVHRIFCVNTKVNVMIFGKV
jgi:hypothetical protein